MQEVRRFLNSLINLLLVNSQFYAISNPLKGIISPFPHGTCALSIKKSYLRLRGWSPYVQTDVSPPYWFGVTKSVTGLSPSLATLSGVFTYLFDSFSLYFAFIRHYSQKLG